MHDWLGETWLFQLLISDWYLIVALAAFFIGQEVGYRRGFHRGVRRERNYPGRGHKLFTPDDDSDLIDRS